MRLFKRNNHLQLTSRSMNITERGLKTLDADKRSIDVVAASEHPAIVWDWERWAPVREVLLMSGARFNRQIPLLDAHTRYSSKNVLGSVRDLRVENGELVGKTFYSSVKEADDAFTKLREGHLTDYSIGYSVEKSVWIEKGKSKEIQGRTFEGPMRVVTRFTVVELSTVPIGADNKAKARNKNFEYIWEDRDLGLFNKEKDAVEQSSTRADAAPKNADLSQLREQIEAEAQSKADSEAQAKIEAERERTASIRELGKKYNARRCSRTGSRPKYFVGGIPNPAG